MGFNVKGVGGSGHAKTQSDLVESNTTPRQENYEEELSLPGLKFIHCMGESELIEFFTNIMRMRQRIKQIDLVLGDEYAFTEDMARVPNSNKLASPDFSVRDRANVFTMALASHPNAIGFKAVIDRTSSGELVSKLYVKIAKNPAHGPIWDNAGVLVSEGDEEFDPKIRIVYDTGA